jgi:hypothetical protein
MGANDKLAATFHGRACATCGATTGLAHDPDASWCREHDPLEQIRARIKAYQGGPFTAEWGELVDGEADILRRRGLDPYRHMTHRPTMLDRRYE